MPVWTSVNPFLILSNPWLWLRHHRPIFYHSYMVSHMGHGVLKIFFAIHSFIAMISGEFDSRWIQLFHFGFNFRFVRSSQLVSSSFPILSAFCNFAFLLSVATVRSCLCFLRLPFQLVDVPSELCAIATAIAVLWRRRLCIAYEYIVGCMVRFSVSALIPIDSQCRLGRSRNR